MKYFFYKLPRNIINSFGGKNIFWHILAIFLTYILVVSGFDWKYFLSVRSDTIHTYLFPAVIIGGLVPLTLPFALALSGAIFKNIQLKLTGFAIGQAALLGWLISSTYKAFTGRIQPNTHDLLNDISHSFQFGFWEHGIFWGWPSSHTTVAFAMAFAFIVTTKNRPAQLLAVLYALYIGLGISIGIHWFSEFVAGAIIGAVIGIAVGSSYKDSQLHHIQ